MVRIRYMGNKHGIATDVAKIVATTFEPRRPFLDLFCGMCSVGGAISSSGRPVWGNDVQRFAASVAQCLLTSPERPPDGALMQAVLSQRYVENAAALNERFGEAAEIERKLLQRPTVRSYQRAHDAWRHVGNDNSLAAEAARLQAAPRSFPYRLATITFAWGYFGLQQAIAIDSVRYALDAAEEAGALSSPQADWGRLALLQAASVMASAPGHFAQYLRAGTTGSLVRILRQRRRPSWTQFLHELALLEPYGSQSWRARNVVLQQDALSLWPDLDALRFRKGIVYADPPYSKDHYSRYYHVLDSLARYDYPQAHGQGRYRPDRFVTSFSLKRSVHSSFERLCREIAVRGHALILSYPTNGLLSDGDEALPTAILRNHFRDVRLALRKPVRHSTLGARHGAQHHRVEELVWLATT